jgi:plastocyanin
VAGSIRVRLSASDVVPAEGTVVWIPGGTPRRPATNPSITSQTKRFSPHVLAVPRGAVVTFPNVDPIFHNVFSRTPGNEFDLGLYRKGARKTYQATTAGLVRVYCNIHPEMAAYMMVLDDAAFAVTDSAGAFRLDGLKPGRHVLHVWNEKTGEREFPVDIQEGRTVAFQTQLDGSAFVPAGHKNKHGKDYPPVRKDDDRY